MEQLCQAWALLKSYGAISVHLHGIYATVVFKSAADASHFSQCIDGAALDSELTVRVDLKEFLRANQ